MSKYGDQNGFTLIELSIVLVIIGMLISMAVNLVGPLNNYIKIRETKELQDATIQSIISWTASRNTLPNKDEFTSIAKSPRDAWSQPFAYQYYSSLSRSPATKDTICGRRNTGLTLYTNYSTASVAFAIISQADSPTFKTRLNGITVTGSGPSPAGTIDASGINADIVRWVTLDELRSRIGCQGAPLKILTNELPTGRIGDKFTVKIAADGGNGAGSYQWRISGDVLPAGIYSTANSLTWTSSVFMNITGHPTQSVGRSITIDVQDNIGNFISKNFALTVN